MDKSDRHYIYAGSEPIAVYSVSAGVNTMSYLLEDHQGGVSAITSSTGAADVNESFSAFGTRRNPGTWSGAPTTGDLDTIASLSRQGYTFQTWLGQSMGLNHMNGRVQDAISGRFLSPDPYISDPTNAQSYNRYSYVNNNPLTLVDPTGFDGESPVPIDPCSDPEACVPEIIVQCTVRCGPDIPMPSPPHLDPIPQPFFSSAPFLPPAARYSNVSAPPIVIPPIAPPTVQLRVLPQSQNPCPGAGAITGRPGPLFDPSLPISRTNAVPSDAVTVTALDGTPFNAPPTADFAGAYRYGQSLSSIPFPADAGGIAVGVDHGGIYDFQRSGNNTFIAAYTYASNYAVGIIMNGAGYSLAATKLIAGGFAQTMSSNAGSPAQVSAWTNGWNAGASGACVRAGH